MKKTKVTRNKPLYLGMAILDVNKTLIYEFWYDYIKAKYGNRAKLCFAVGRWFDTFNHDENDERSLSIGENKRATGFLKDELGGKIMKEF